MTRSPFVADDDPHLEAELEAYRADYERMETADPLEEGLPRLVRRLQDKRTSLLERLHVQSAAHVSQLVRLANLGSGVVRSNELRRWLPLLSSQHRNDLCDELGLEAEFRRDV